MSKVIQIRSLALKSALFTLALVAVSCDIQAKQKGNPHDDDDRQDTVQTGSADVITGCLHKEGQLRRFAEGGNPRKPCNPNEKTIQLEMAGANEVEPFALAFGEGQTRILAENGGLQFSATCTGGGAFLAATGGIILNPPAAFPIPLTEPVADTELPALLGTDGSFLSVHDLHVAFGQLGTACIVTGNVERSKVDLP